MDLQAFNPDWEASPSQMLQFHGSSCVVFALQTSELLRGRGYEPPKYLHNGHHGAMAFIQDGSWVIIDSSARDTFALREHEIFKSTGTKPRTWKLQNGRLEMMHEEDLMVFEEVSATTMVRRTNLQQF